MSMPQGRALSKYELRGLVFWAELLIHVVLFHIPLLVVEFVWAICFAGNPHSGIGPILTLINMGYLTWICLAFALTALVYHVPLKQGWFDAIKNTGRTFSKKRRSFTIGVTILLWYAVVWSLTWLVAFGILPLIGQISLQ
ncbi:hypothetical protein F9K94_21300 [Brucella tritici]|uniref:Uncharacterized protein n=1 Tax=Brucella tritici TaxID=94626 RepID=A0A7V7VQS1_9HYPH|nr:hypothetical protein [Brucella tritici]KAB2655096.1 hypothetical protein F9K94_21300 [Brucella tritici]